MEFELEAVKTLFDENEGSECFNWSDWNGLDFWRAR
jgi:hypothetical protein